MLYPNFWEFPQPTPVTQLTPLAPAETDRLRLPVPAEAPGPTLEPLQVLADLRPAEMSPGAAPQLPALAIQQAWQGRMGRPLQRMWIGEF